MRLFEVKTDYRIFVDLDGVMADLDKLVKERTGKTFEQLRATGSGFTKFVAAEREAGSPIFDDVDKMPGADYLWGYLVVYNPDKMTTHGQHIATATAAKIRRVMDNHRGYNQILTTTSGAEKKKDAAPNHILIDDRMKAIGPWREAGGIGILHTSTEDTISQLKSLGL